MDILNKTIFITGGAGFIATGLIGRLVESNKIVVYDNFERDTLTHSPYADHENLTIIRGDILDASHLSKSMEGADIVVHAAAIAGIDTVIKSPTKTMNVNMIGTANVLEAAMKCGIKDRLIEFSTSEVFGSYAYKSKEEDQTVSGSAGEARWTYAVSKLAGEHLAKAYHTEFGLPVVSVRPFNVYGPGQTGEGAIHIFIKKALRNQDINIYGEGNQIRAWCYLDDFLDCLLLCISCPEAVGHSFNIGNARAVITIYGLAELVCRILNSTSKINFLPALSADVELRIPSIEKAYTMLGFKSKIDLEEGVLRTAQWYKGNLG